MLRFAGQALLQLGCLLTAAERAELDAINVAVSRHFARHAKLLAQALLPALGALGAAQRTDLHHVTAGDAAAMPAAAVPAATGAATATASGSDPSSTPAGTALGAEETAAAAGCVAAGG